MYRQNVKSKRSGLIDLARHYLIISAAMKLTKDLIKKTLKHFSETEKRTDGQPIQWEKTSLDLFCELDSIRTKTKKRIRIIREHHDERDWHAVDFISDAPMAHVVMTLLALNNGVGIYCGTRGPSYHIDERKAVRGRPPRWLAVRPKYKDFIDNQELITSENTEWIYLKFEHPETFKVLGRMILTAEAERARFKQGNKKK